MLGDNILQICTCYEFKFFKKIIKTIRGKLCFMHQDMAKIISKNLSNLYQKYKHIPSCLNVFDMFVKYIFQLSGKDIFPQLVQHIFSSTISKITSKSISTLTGDIHQCQLVMVMPQTYIIHTFVCVICRYTSVASNLIIFNKLISWIQLHC